MNIGGEGKKIFPKNPGIFGHKYPNMSLPILQTTKKQTLNQSNAQSETAISKQVGFSVDELKLKFGSEVKS